MNGNDKIFLETSRKEEKYPLEKPSHSSVRIIEKAQACLSVVPEAVTTVHCLYPLSHS